MKYKINSVFTIILILMLQISRANDSLVSRSWDFGIGIGYGEQSNPFIGADDVPGFITLDLAVYGEKFFFDNGDVGFTLYDSEKLGFNLIASYNTERIYYSYFNDLAILGSGSPISGSAPAFDVIPIDQIGLVSSPGDVEVVPLEIPDRDFAVNLGFEFLFDAKYLQIQGQLSSDVSSVHDGHQFELDFSRSWSRNRWAFRAHAGLSWKSSQIIDYYYGLDDENVPFNVTYQGQSTTNVNFGLLLSYRINNNLSYVNHFKYTKLGTSISDSPLINSNSTQSYFSGLFYRF